MVAGPSLNANALLTLTNSRHVKLTGLEAEDCTPGPWAAITCWDFRNILGPLYFLCFILLPFLPHSRFLVFKGSASQTAVSSRVTLIAYEHAARGRVYSFPPPLHQWGGEGHFH